jgi:hypothetical protein
MTSFSKCLGAAKFSNHHEEDKFLTTLVMELIDHYTDLGVVEVISVQKYKIVVKLPDESHYYIGVEKDVSFIENSDSYCYTRLLLSFYSIFPKIMKFELSTFYKYHSSTFMLDGFFLIKTNFEFKTKKDITISLSLDSSDGHDLFFFMEDDEVVRKLYLKGKLINTDYFSFSDFEILFKCQILEKCQKNILYDIFPYYFGPQQNTLNNQQILDILMLIDIFLVDFE